MQEHILHVIRHRISEFHSALNFVLNIQVMSCDKIDLKSRNPFMDVTIYFDKNGVKYCNGVGKE